MLLLVLSAISDSFCLITSHITNEIGHISEQMYYLFIRRCYNLRVMIKLITQFYFFLSMFR